MVKQIRRAAGGLKTGHAGTLDPFAEGLLIVGIGRAATRRLGDYMKLEKEYFAAVAWGAATDTGDPTGKIVAEAYEATPGEGQIIEALRRFQGVVEQTPPAYSAVKVGGVRLYKAARRGERVEAKPRPVEIRELELVNRDDQGFEFRVVCSHGTYVRTLAEDLAQALGGYAHLKRLIRTRIGEFHLEDAESLEGVVERLTAGGKRS